MHVKASNPSTTEPSPSPRTSVVPTTIVTTPNPFAPLVDDAKDDDAPNDVQRALTPVSSACMSSVIRGGRCH